MMKKLFYTPLILIVTLTSPLPVVAETSPRILIAQLQTGSKASASEEFVSLYNDSDATLDASLYSLEYSSASSGLTWSTKASLTGLWYPHAYYLLASTNYLTDISDASFSAGLAKTGGHIRVVKIENNVTAVLDTVGWGTTAHPEGSPAVAPAESNVLERLISENGNLIDNENNAKDFFVNVVQNPKSTNEPPVIPVTKESNTTSKLETAPTPTVDAAPISQLVENPLPVEVQPVPLLPENPPIEAVGDQAQSTQNQVTDVIASETVQSNPVSEIPIVETVIFQEDIPQNEPASELPVYHSIEITELYPNPAAPETDDKDEFIELYNPHEFEVNLKDYKLQTGDTLSHSAELDFVIDPLSYVVVNAGQFNVPLSNSGGKARLLDPNGQIVSEASHYGAAKAGESWSLIDGRWTWTTIKTPLEDNKPTPLPIQSLSVTATSPKISKILASAAPTKKLPEKKVTAPKLKKVASKQAKSVLASKKSTDSPTSQNSTAKSNIPTTTTLPIHPKVLAGVGLLAVGYAVYEYREDIRNRIWKLRRNYRIRQEIRQES